MTQQIIRPHRLVWFEIPASDFDRAVRFYEEILAVKTLRDTMGPAKMAVLPYDPPAVSGCVMMAPGLKPGADGVQAYLNAEPALDDVLNRVTGAGGQIVQPRTDLPAGMGVFAKIRDTEGNIVGLHALV
jgi:hypothetical protein